MKNKKKDLPDLLVSQVNFYGEEIDFFFLAASMTRIEKTSVEEKTRELPSLVLLEPEEI